MAEDRFRSLSSDALKQNNEHSCAAKQTWQYQASHDSDRNLSSPSPARSPGGLEPSLISVLVAFARSTPTSPTRAQRRIRR